MTKITLEAEHREIVGKGASRRLRHANKVPAIIYGGGKAPTSVQLLHNKVLKALEDESIYSSLFDLDVAGKIEHVVLKDLHRHPYKPVILHMDLQRVSPTDVIVKTVPLHFINEQTAKGVKAGGQISHTMNQVEIRCQVKHLPEFIEVDMSSVGLDDILHMSDLKLPKHVELSLDLKDSKQDHPVVSIHANKGADSEATETAV